MNKETLIHEYASDWLVNETPWELWEYRSKTHDEGWQPLYKHPAWDSSCEYRRKQVYAYVNGYKVVLGLSSMPAEDVQIYLPQVLSSSLVYRFDEDESWTSRDYTSLLEHRLMYTDRQSAIARAKAMLGISPDK